MLGVANVDTEPPLGTMMATGQRPSRRTTADSGGWWSDRAQPQARERPGWISRAESEQERSEEGARRKEGGGNWGE